MGGLVDTVVPRWHEQSWWWTSFRAVVVAVVKVLLNFSHRFNVYGIVLTNHVVVAVHFDAIFRALADRWSFWRISMSRTTRNARIMFVFSLKESKGLL
jgi:hypothetical protein